MLRLGEYLVGRACQQLPPDMREERYREWAAELPAILQDPRVRFAPRRAVRMLDYAADTLRGTIMVQGRARDRITRMFAAADLLVLVAGLVVALDIWAVVQAPGDALTYLRLAWGLLFVAYLIRKRVFRSAGRVTALLGIGALLAFAALCLGNAAQAPGDWVNYFLAALLLVPVLVGLPLAWWLGRLQARTGGRHAAPSDPWTLWADP